MTATRRPGLPLYLRAGSLSLLANTTARLSLDTFGTAS
jgi:hypothetical protein